MRFAWGRRGALVFFAALAAYANSMGNGFAYDDTWVLEDNPIVTEGRFDQVLSTPYWPGAVPGTGNYRPLTVASFVAGWSVWGGAPWGFHLMNVLLHGVASVLVFALAATLTGVVGGVVGGLFFAVHPVHVEAVANVVGRAELLSAVFVVLAVLLYLRGDQASVAHRALVLVGVTVCYGLALASKEMGVTLPALLLVVAATGDSARTDERLRRAVPVLVALGAVLVTYLAVRLSVLGVLTGESPAAGLRGLSTPERVFTALTIWPHYLRLMLFPLDLSMDYQPAVLPVARTFTVDSALGAAILVGLAVLAWRLRGRRPVVGLGLIWFVIAILPVSNLLVRADVLLAERTLYLPSVGISLAVGSLAATVATMGHVARRRAVAVGVVLFGALMIRTITRNPAWMDTSTALSALGGTHPESYVAVRARAAGLERVGDIEAARDLYGIALELAPGDYGLRVEVGTFYTRHDEKREGERILREAIGIVPNHPYAYRRLSEVLLLDGRGREAHAVALAGLGEVGADGELFALVSESYVAKGDFEAAVRAREAAAAQLPGSRNQWRRLAELYDRLGRRAQADEARQRADALPDEPLPKQVVF